MKNAKKPSDVKPLPNQSGMPDPLSSLDENLRADPLPFTEGIEIGFDRQGPKGKKIKNTYLS